MKPAVLSEGTIGSGHKLKYRKFHLETGDLVTYFTVRWLNSEEA